MTIRYEELKPRIGAIVHASKEQLGDANFARECLELLDDRAVLVFPRVSLSDEEQLAFTDMLGTRSEYSKRNVSDADGESDVYRVSLDPKIKMDTQYVLATYFWHMDGVTVADFDPPAATLLSARQLPAKGGQTEFASTFAAYDALPEEEKAELLDMRAIHSVYAGVRPILDFSIGPGDWNGEASQTEKPLVWTHESGRKSLVLGVQVEGIVGMDMPVARAFVSRLMEWATQPDFKYRHEWSEGDLVMWKNLGTLHRVIPYEVDSGRLMHRTSLANLQPVA